MSTTRISTASPAPDPDLSEPGPRALTAAEALLPIVLGWLLLGLTFRLFGDAATGGALQTAIICATAGAMLIGLSPVVTILVAALGIRMLRNRWIQPVSSDPAPSA